MYNCGEAPSIWWLHKNMKCTFPLKSEIENFIESTKPQNSGKKEKTLTFEKTNKLLKRR